MQLGVVDANKQVNRSLSAANLLVLYTELLSHWPCLYWCDIVANVRDSDCFHGVRVIPVGSTNWYPVNFGRDCFFVSTNLCFKPSETAVSFRIRLICAPESNKIFPCFRIPSWP